MENNLRSLQLFFEGCKSEETYKVYKYYLDQFLKWAHKDYESLLLLPSDQLQPLLEDYLFYKKKRMNPNSLKGIFAALIKFLELNDKEIKKRKLRQFFPEELKPTGSKAWSTEQIQKMLEYADTKRGKALIHFLAATGSRIGTLAELKWKHISPISKNCYSVILYPRSKHEYVSFLHSEAVEALDDYRKKRERLGEKINGESYVFRSRFRWIGEKPKPMTPKAVRSVVDRIVKRAGIIRVKEENSERFDIQVDTAFRKRFNTILKSNPNISYAIAERLMDHKTYLESHYLDTSNKEKLFEEYKKAIPDLVIEDSERDKLRIQKLEKETEGFEKKYAEIENQKQVIKTVEQRVADAEQLIQDIIGGKFAEILKAKRPEIPVDPSLDKVDLR